MHVAITGGTGFLGLHLVRRLLAEHRTLTLLVRRDRASTLDLLRRFLTAVGDPPEFIDELPARIETRRADVSCARFGMSDQEFTELADELDVLWHSAGDTTLVADLDALRAINVAGVRTALELVEAGRKRPMLYHVGTAFVAGRRQYGTVYDDELTDAYGFETPYERSKYEAELLVRDWQRRHRRPVVVFRPSILTTDLPYDPGLPVHPMIDAAWSLDAVRRASARSGVDATAGRPVRLAGNPDAQLNFIPVEDSADLMVRLSLLPAADRLTTYHIVGREEVPAALVLRAIGEAIGTELELVGSLDDPDPLETRMNLLASVTVYLRHQRRYDDARVRSLVGAVRGGRVDFEYLRRGLTGLRPVAATP